MKTNSQNPSSPLRGDRGGLRVGVLGAAGYTGGELIRLLLNHPQAEIVFANSDRRDRFAVYVRDALRSG